MTAFLGTQMNGSEANKCYSPESGASSNSASRARSSADSIRNATARASKVPAFAVSASPVQTGVQTLDTLAASSFPVLLASRIPLLDTLGVTGSSPVAPIFSMILQIKDLGTFLPESFSISCRKSAASWVLQGFCIAGDRKSQPLPSCYGNMDKAKMAIHDFLYSD
jgi:hypothetical protein